MSNLFNQVTVLVLPDFVPVSNHKTNWVAHFELTQLLEKDEISMKPKFYDYFIRLDTRNQEGNYYQICRRFKGYQGPEKKTATCYCSSEAMMELVKYFYEVDAVKSDFTPRGDITKYFFCQLKDSVSNYPHQLYFDSYQDWDLITHLLTDHLI